MSIFQISFDLTEDVERGWQNDPADTGNSSSGLGTYKGLASSFQPKWKGWPIVKAEIAKLPPQPPYGTRAYSLWVKTLNAALAANAELQAMVASYYKANFWDVNNLGLISSQLVANKVYDAGVNRGTGTAAILLQKVLGLMTDGQIGPVTIKAANAVDGNELAEKYRQARIADYERLIKINPKLAQYKASWLGRC